jgi:hypothetical protein
MPVDSQTSALGLIALWATFKAAALVIAVLYFGFSLIVVRQVYLMTETVRTGTSGFFRFLAIMHAGLSLGIIILFLGLLI